VKRLQELLNDGHFKNSPIREIDMDRALENNENFLALTNPLLQ
jgi:hypothetical protein